MTCQEMVALLIELSDDNLDEASREELERHCTLCPDCEHFKSSYELTLQLTEKAFVRELPTDARARIEAALRLEFAEQG